MLFLFAIAVGLIGLLIGYLLHIVAIRILKRESIALSPFSFRGEFITAILFGIMTWHFEFSLELIIALLFVSLLVVIMITDLCERVIPNRIIYPGMIAIALLRIFIHSLPVYNYLFAFLIGGGIILAVSIVGSFVFHQANMGGGDIKLFALIGLVVGMKLIFLAIFFASLLGALYGVYLTIKGRYQSQLYIAFAPFIAAGSITAYIWGDALIAWYLKQLL